MLSAARTHESSAALLLMRFSKAAANDESFYSSAIPPMERKVITPMTRRPTLLGPSRRDSPVAPISQDSFEGPTRIGPSLTSFASRPRSVSLATIDQDSRVHEVSPFYAKEVIRTSSSFSSDLPGFVEEPPARSIVSVSPTSPLSESSWTCTELKSSPAFVGDETADGVEVRAVLRKKFSWKQFPELETYLVEHREQYLQFSSMMNYTSDQKRYNNKLTQGLLELAAEHGYVFEEFTFPMIRDRIRCYYKSFVQAVKKKKRKKKR